MFKFLSLAIAAAALSFASLAYAHSKLQSSTPANGATVAEAKTVTLTFTHDVRLATLKLTGKNVDADVPVDRTAQAGKSFSLPLPAIGPGAYQIAWTASASDGHVMTGSFAFTIAAPTGQP